MSDIRTFHWPHNIPVPRHSRRVSTPIDGSDVRVVSDLIPTQSITEDFPVVGTKYGAIDWANRTVPARFANHEYYRMVEEDGDYTRLFFNPASADVNDLTAFKTIWTYDSSIYWPTIVESIDFFSSDAELVAGAPGYYHGTPDSVWLVMVKKRPAYKGLTKLRIQQFISSIDPFDFSSSTQTSFTPTEIQWNLGGANGRGGVEESLHPEIAVPGTDITDVARYVWNSDDPFGRATSLGSDFTARFFKETGGLEADATVGSVTHPYLWLNQIVDDKVTPKGGLYIREIVTAYRPEPEELVEEYQS